MENYEIVSNIGKGSFGTVSKVRRKSDGKILVWKELNYGKMSEKEKQQLVAEVNILRELRHPNIVRYYDRIIDKKEAKIYIIMEYCEGGDMGRLLKKCKQEKDYIAEDVIWKVFSQIVFALQECHNRKSGKILHRDLKPANIFLDSQNNIKLGDFGLSRVMGDQSVFAYTHVGTPYYMSPEQINESKYNEKSDIWSAGCLLYEIAALRPPFEATNHLSLAIKIKAGKFDRIPIRYSEELQKLIEVMLTVDPKYRPGVEDLLRHPTVDLKKNELMLKEKHEWLKKKNDEIKKKEQETKKWEEALKTKEEELKKLEMSLKDTEDRLQREEAVTGISPYSFKKIPRKSTDEKSSAMTTPTAKDLNTATSKSSFKDCSIEAISPIARNIDSKGITTQGIYNHKPHEKQYGRTTGSITGDYEFFKNARKAINEMTYQYHKAP